MTQCVKENIYVTHSNGTYNEQRGNETKLYDLTPFVALLDLGYDAEKSNGKVGKDTHDKIIHNTS